MEIAFGILCAKESSGAVTQLIDSLGGDDPVIVDHDASKQPAFRLDRPDAYLIPDYVQTDWGAPSLVHAIFHLMKTALKRSRFDYFQLLSGSCLPLRPVAALKRHLAANAAEIHADVIDLSVDERAMMSHGHRVFCRSDKFAARLLHRSRRWYFGSEPSTIQQAGLGIYERQDPQADLTTLQWLGKQVHLAARAGLLDSHPFRRQLTPCVGSLWFCLRRDVCEYLVEQEQSSSLMPYLLGLKLCDEILFSTLLGNSQFRIAPSSHMVNDFIEEHPRPFTGSDLERLAGSERFFARKFSADPGDSTRQEVLAMLAARAIGHPHSRAREASVVTAGSG